MGSIQSSTMIFCALGNRGASFFIPKGALTHHLVGTNSISLALPFGAELTHSVVPPLPKKSCDFPGPLSAVVFPTEAVRSPSGMRLLRKPNGQCHITKALLSLSTQLVCGKRLQNTVTLTDGIPPTARTNLPQHKALPSVAAALSAVMTITIADSHFLFQKEKQKLNERIGTNEWRSIIWKPRS